MVLKSLMLTGVSPDSWEDAARIALEEAAKSIKGIEWLEVREYSAKISEERIVEYRAAVKVTFRIEDGLRHAHHHG